MTMLGAVEPTETTTVEADDNSDEGGSSLEEDARSDGEGQSHSFCESDRYLMPVEVEAQLRLLWMHHEEVLDFIWLRATGLHRGSSGDTKGDGWRMFFTRIVLVPPSRFRPPGKVGDMIAEHPQNTHLKKVLVADAAIRAIYSLDTQQKQQDPTSEQQQLQLAPSPSASNSAAAIDLSKVVSKWIELQNAVNCYMDSSKDSNVLAKIQGGPAGIRQILERKEGLFRKHMMGKRVNFCCRSVISPDPYIGTNEIGVPVHFAMSLHYPTPVNSWNVKYLRGLVRRGPFQYPGTYLSAPVRPSLPPIRSALQFGDDRFMHHSVLS
jgi:DNA-directed RNA polymerase I subunit RPA1